MDPRLAHIVAPMEADGYAFVRAPEIRGALEALGLEDWEGFAASWDRLGLDTFMADGGRYRKRRHAAFAVSAPGTVPGAASGVAPGATLGAVTGATSEGLRRKPHQPHYQSRDYNALNGGIARWFEPMEEAVAGHPATLAILRGCRILFDTLTPAAVRPPVWHVELHQFRIEAQAGREGRPTPEGLHRDGVDWVLVLLVARENIASGETTIHDLQRRPLGSFTLTEPMDSALVDDGRVYHGVTPVEPLDPARPAHRDVLVVTFRRE